MVVYSGERYSNEIRPQLNSNPMRWVSYDKCKSPHRSLSFSRKVFCLCVCFPLSSLSIHNHRVFNLACRQIDPVACNIENLPSPFYLHVKWCKIKFVLPRTGKSRKKENSFPLIVTPHAFPSTSRWKALKSIQTTSEGGCSISWMVIS